MPTRSPNPPLPMPHRPNIADRILGELGAAVIALVIGCARMWARVTRAPWYGD